MPEARPTDRRWRAFADAVAVALGANVWVSMVILPALFVGALRSTSMILAALAAPAALGIGVQRRSEVVLLGAFPATILIPLAIRPDMADAHVYGPVRFTIVAVGLIAYLLGVSFFTTFHEAREPVSERLLTSATQRPPARWRRRERVYWALAALGFVVPAFLIAVASYGDTVTRAIDHFYPGRVAAMSTLVVLAAVALSFLLVAWVFLGVMRALGFMAAMVMFRHL